MNMLYDKAIESDRCNLCIGVHKLNETNVVFGMSVRYMYRSLFLKKMFFFYQLMILNQT